MGNTDSAGVLDDDVVKRRAIAKMDSEMRSKMNRGVNYNMRIVIRGETMTGKTCLWRRLQGHPFGEADPTTSIQVCTIPWSYKAADDVVKVEVWDVVDKARRRKTTANQNSGGLKLNNNDKVEYEETDDELEIPIPSRKDQKIQAGSHIAVGYLDAKNVDVMQGTNAVIFMMDQRKDWTWTYVQHEVAKIPNTLPVLILSNFRDLGESKIVVLGSTIRQFCKQRGGETYYLEASMKDCYGLLGVRAFLNFPFLKLQKKYIEALHKQNKSDTKTCQEEFTFCSELEYDGWVQKIKRREETVPRSESYTRTAPVSDSYAIEPSETEEGDSDSENFQETKKSSKGKKRERPNRKGDTKTLPARTPQTSGAFVIVDDEQEREKQRALEAYRREEELKRKELELAQQKAAALQAAKPKPQPLQAQQSPPKKGSSLSANATDNELEKRILEKLKQEKVKQKNIEKEEQESQGGLLGFVTSVFGSSDKEAEATEPEDEIVDGLRKLAEARKIGQEPVEDVVGIDEFVPDVEDEGNFWDEEAKEPEEEKEKSEESSEEGGNSALLADDDGEEELQIKITPKPKPVTPKVEEKPKESVLAPVYTREPAKTSANPSPIADAKAQPSPQSSPTTTAKPPQASPTLKPVPTPSPTPTPTATPKEAPKRKKVKESSLDSTSEEESESDEDESDEEDIFAKLSAQNSALDDDPWAFDVNAAPDDSVDFMVQKKYPNPQTSIIRHVELTRQTGHVASADEAGPTTEEAPKKKAGGRGRGTGTRGGRGRGSPSGRGRAKPKAKEGGDQPQPKLREGYSYQ